MTWYESLGREIGHSLPLFTVIDRVDTRRSRIPSVEGWKESEQRDERVRDRKTARYVLTKNKPNDCPEGNWFIGNTGQCLWEGVEKEIIPIPSHSSQPLLRYTVPFLYRFSLVEDDSGMDGARDQTV